jgi:hypothetical protein
MSFVLVLLMEIDVVVVGLVIVLVVWAVPLPSFYIQEVGVT